MEEKAWMSTDLRADMSNQTPHPARDVMKVVAFAGQLREGKQGE